MNKLMIATLASMLFLAMVPAAWAAGTADGNTPDWQSMSPEDLLWAAQNLTGDDPAVTAARQSLISTVTSKYVSAGSVKSLTLGQWESLSGFLAPGLSAEAKAQWAAAITQAYAGSGETAASPSARDVEQLTSILDRLDAKDLAADLMARLARDSNVVQPMSFPKLIWMLDGLTGDTPAIKAARQNIADLVTTKFLADPAATRSVSSGQWEDIARRLSAGLPAEQRGQWAGKLRAAYVQDATGLASLKQYGDLENLIKALANLGEKQDDLDGVAATFVKGTTLWQSWPPAEVVSLASRIAALGELGATARQALITAVTSKHVSAGSGKSVTPGQWESLTGFLAPGLSAETKAQWAAAIIQAYVGSGETAGALTARDVEQLIATFRRLDAGGQAVDAVAKLVNDSAAWQNWDLKSQAWLLGLLAAPDSRESTKPARLKILDRMTATYMPTVEEAKKVPLRQWANLIMGLHDVMPAEIRTLWAERLRSVFDNATLAGLANDAEQRNALLPAIAILDDKMKTGLALSWLKDKTLWQGAPIEALANLTAAAYRDNSEETLPILDDVDKFCVARHATQPLTLGECLALRHMYVSAGQLPKAQQWVLVGCDVTIGTEALRAAADQATVVSLSLALVDTALVGPEKDTTKLAATVAAVASKGGLDFRLAWQPKCVGEALGTPAGRQIVRDALLDADKTPRLGVAKILATAYRMYSDFKPWRTYVDEQLAAAPDGQDRKALWVLVKGYTDSVTPEKQNLLLVEVGATKALGQAASEPVRVLALRELADVYEQRNRPGVAVSIIESIKNQFTGDYLTQVETLQKNLKGKEAARLVQEERAQAAAEAARKKALLAYYEKSLAKATAEGDSARVTKLQAAIAALKSKLAG